jgi:hypothetical protein
MNDKLVSKLIVECDFDGVLYNVTEYLIEEATDQFGIDIKESDLLDYNFKPFPLDVKKYIVSRYADSEVMTNENWLYRDTIEFLKWVNEQEEIQCKIRTLVINKEVQKARENFLANILAENDLNNISYDVVLNKELEPCDVLIEDNPKAILSKEDGIVIMRKHSYNSYIEETNNILIANNLKEIQTNLEKILVKDKVKTKFK